MGSRDEVNKTWEIKWDEGRTAWHIEHVNPHLEEFFTQLVGDLEGKNILVPMCGKSIDLKWLHDKGMNVLGVEFVEMPIKEFFDEHNMDYTVEESQVLPGCNIYRHGDRMSIYQCDIFKITCDLFGGPLDFLWDCGSLVAVEYENKQSYSDVIQSVLSSTAHGLIEAMGYDRVVHPGPPFSTTEDDVRSFFSGRFTIEKLSDRKNDELPEWYRSKIPGNIYRVFYIQGKNQ